MSNNLGMINNQKVSLNFIYVFIYSVRSCTNVTFVVFRIPTEMQFSLKISSVASHPKWATLSFLNSISVKINIMTID